MVGVKVNVNNTEIYIFPRPNSKIASGRGVASISYPGSPEEPRYEARGGA